MITVTSEALQNYLAGHRFANITNITALTVVILAVAVIVEREIVRLSSPRLAKRNVVAFAIVAVPLLLLFASIVLVRFAKLSA